MAIFGCNFNAFMPMCSFAPIGYPRPMMPPMPMARPIALGSPIFSCIPRPYMPMPMPILPYSMPIFAPRFNYPEFTLDLSIYNGVNNAIVNGTTTFNPFLAMPQFQCCIPPVPSYASSCDNSFLSLTRGSSRTSSCSKTKKSSGKGDYSISSKSDLSEVNKVGYNPEKGQSLVKDALNHAESKSTGWCAKYVKEAIDRECLGNNESGNAYQWGNILSRNPNFKEVNVSGIDLRKLPAGCVIVYNKGVAGYSSSYGHIEITTGTGSAVSDFVNYNIKTPGSGVRVFVPV